MDGRHAERDVGDAVTIECADNCLPDWTDRTAWPDRTDWTDSDLMALCRSDELHRRHTEGRLIVGLIELERRKAYLEDGFRCLAGWGRGIQRWSDHEARSRRDLTKLAMTEPVIVERLLTGRIGVAQAHLIGRLSRAPRVGQFVPLFLAEFLEQAAVMSYADFEQHIRNWRLLVDQDGADPSRAHRDRSATLSHSDHEFRLVVTGPAIDGAQWGALLHQVEQIEWERDWRTTEQVHGDMACPALMPRSSAQRRYDAFCSLLTHIGNRAPGDIDGSEDGAIGVVVNIVVDARTFARGVDELFAAGPRPRIPTPFGPDAALSQTFDGTFVAPRDAVLAALAGRARMLLTGDNGHVVAMTKSGRLFTGAMRDAVLATASRCTHPGCLVASIDCEIDHLMPHSRGGPTSVANAGPACRHHNNWRYASGALIERQVDGTWATYRRDGTRVAPPD